MKYRIKEYTNHFGNRYYCAQYKDPNSFLGLAWSDVEQTYKGEHVTPMHYLTLEDAYRAVTNHWNKILTNKVHVTKVLNYTTNNEFELELVE